MLEEIVAILRELVAINSVNSTLSGGPGEGEIAAFIRAYLSRLGLQPQLQLAAAERPNVVVRVPGKSYQASVLLNGHIDTVGVAGMDSPFALRPEGDRLYGRGAYDMKGSVAVMLALAGYWAEHPPRTDVWLTFSCDEEDRSLGTEALVTKWLPTLPVRPAGAIFLEPTEEDIGVAHKGFSWFEIEILGRAAHGSRPEEGIDAILPLRAALEEIETIRSELRARPPDALLGQASLHGGRIEGGTELSVVPAQARLQWERRTLPDEEPDAVDAELERVARAVAGLPGGHTVQSRKIFMRPPYRTPPEAEILRRLRQAAPSSAAVGLSFWADSALMGHAGIPSVLYGPVGHGAHAVDEWVSGQSLVNVYSVLKRIFGSEH